MYGMSADPQLRSPMWDDEIDLRQLIETLLHRKWMIAGVIAVAVAIAAVYSFFMLPPRYEASIVVAVPDAAASERLGMSTKAYEAFALNTKVLGTMISKGNLNLESPAVEKRLKLNLDAGSRLLTVTVHAQTAAEAEQLARLWQQSFQSELLAHVQNLFGIRLQHAQGKVAGADATARTATARLDDFERSHSIGLKEARLARWEEELISTEARLQQLTEQSIPTDMARVSFLEDVLTTVQPTLERGNAAVVVSDTKSGAGVTSSDVTILNPIYLELNQDLTMTRTRLMANEQAAALLQVRFEELPVQLDALRAEVVALRTERSRLHNEAVAADRLHDDMRRNFQQLSMTYGDLEQLAAIAVIAEPMQPSSPVAPRKMLNIALAAFLGAFVGVGAAFFQQFWEEKPA